EGCRCVYPARVSAKASHLLPGRDLQDAHLRRFKERRDAQSVFLEGARQPEPRATDGVILEEVDDHDAIGERAVRVRAEQLGGTKCSGHAGIDATRRAIAPLDDESFAYVSIERQPAVDASNQHQAAEL